MPNVAAKTRENDEIIQWVTFRLSNETYGINVMQVQEVLRVSEIAPVPGAPHYVLGIINLRGNVVTVVDTRIRLGLEATEVTDSTRIVIIEGSQHVVGILVDCVAEVVDLCASELESAPNVGNEESAKYIQGVASHDGELLILVDLNKLLSDEEWRNWPACSWLIPDANQGMQPWPKLDSCHLPIVYHPAIPARVSGEAGRPRSASRTMNTDSPIRIPGAKSTMTTNPV